MKIQQLSDIDETGLKLRETLYAPGPVTVNTQMASCGIAAGADKTFARAVADFSEDKNIQIRKTGCLGFCEMEPLVEIYRKDGPRILYRNATEDKITDMVNGYGEGRFHKKLVLGQMRDPRSLLEEGFENPLEGLVPVPEIPFLEDIPFYDRQIKIALRNCGYIDPEKIEEYMARGGYKAFLSALERDEPKEIISTIKDSGLRGRGGGGFPAGVKWESCAAHHGERYIICNADEGDPGAYMDRSILEGDPHAIIEGMLVAGLAIGSNKGFIYVRNEYPLAVKRLVTAIRQATDYGLLGEDIAGSGFSFDMKISTGAGAFVCGESTALMASLEGEVGRPRAKYIHTVEKGFRQGPTNLNNVETYANVPAILAKGAEWFQGLGTEHSKGTKVFSLVGKIENTGLVEVPMGTSLRNIIYDIGGGIPKKKAFKAVQTGGPSGGCIPEAFLDLGVDFSELAKVGSIMGSGGMIVMDQDTCMVDVARYFLDFLKEESCGQCNPCREGIKRMLEVLNRICRGDGREGDIELLRELGGMVHNFSLCGLGTSAPNPVLTTIKYFRDEYEAHIRDKKCPAGICKPLFHYEIDENACTGCTLCARKCPREAITGEKKDPHELEQEKCIKCGICYEVCKFDAVRIA